MVNVGLIPYLFSKFLVLGVIVGIQCILLFLPLKLLDLTGLMPMPGAMMGVPQLGVMLLTAGVGIAIGLLISAQVKTSELATSLVPLILIPQILFSGLIGVPSGVNKAVGLLMPATWAFDTMKRYSTLDTLEEEGADPNGSTNGLGYYEYIETENDRIIADSRTKIEKYKKDAEAKIDDFESELKAMRDPAKPRLDDPPRSEDAKRIDQKEMSNYVSFLHPWMNKGLNISSLC
jgi:ABC-type transport system involved in multi-copper enzyme maturation permease subunit